MFGKGDCRFLGNVTWDGFRWRDCEDGWGQGRGLKVQVGKNTVEMEVPKRWFLRKSEGPGPEQSVIVESGYWEVGVIATRLQFASRLLVDIKFAQYPVAG